MGFTSTALRLRLCVNIALTKLDCLLISYFLSAALPSTPPVTARCIPSEPPEIRAWEEQAQQQEHQLSKWNTSNPMTPCFAIVISATPNLTQPPWLLLALLVHNTWQHVGG